MKICTVSALLHLAHRISPEGKHHSSELLIGYEISFDSSKWHLCALTKVSTMRQATPNHRLLSVRDCFMCTAIFKEEVVLKNVQCTLKVTQEAHAAYWLAHCSQTSTCFSESEQLWIRIALIWKCFLIDQLYIRAKLPDTEAERSIQRSCN